jgi:DNA-binding SARP family transcriptional activator
MHTAPRPRIFLLGRFGVEVDGNAIPASSWRRRRPIEVLAALALAPGHVLHREELIDRLWPDKDLDAGANNLDRALHDLRRVTGVELATLERRVAKLSETAWVDVDAFVSDASATITEAKAVGAAVMDIAKGDPGVAEIVAMSKTARGEWKSSSAITVAVLAPSPSRSCIRIRSSPPSPIGPSICTRGLSTRISPSARRSTAVRRQPTRRSRSSSGTATRRP